MFTHIAVLHSDIRHVPPIGCYTVRGQPHMHVLAPAEKNDASYNIWFGIVSHVTHVLLLLLFSRLQFLFFYFYILEL